MDCRFYRRSLEPSSHESTTTWIGSFKACKPFGAAVSKPFVTVSKVYDLQDDPAESIDVASEHPDIVREMLELFSSARVESELFPLS